MRLHPKRPKVSLNSVIRKIHSVGATYSDKDPDIAIVVGGDGTFGYYGRILSDPILFVGVHEQDILGSKARLAHIYFEDLEKSLMDIQRSKFSIEERRMLCVRYGKTKPKEILTDIYLERGISAGCIRYSISIDSKQKLKYHTSQKFTDYAIGNGVIISTSFGSAGYYNYLDRIKLNKLEGNKYMKGFEDNRIGISHIIPSFLIHESYEKNHRMYKIGNIQYTVPIESIIKVSLVRKADARLYGTTYHSKGVAVDVDSLITICQSNRTAKIIKLNTQARVKRI